jgi:hypothetical protein
MSVSDWMVWVGIALGAGWALFVLTLMIAVLRVSNAAAAYLESRTSRTP